MGNIVRGTSRGQMIVHSFGQDAVAASQTNVQLPVTVGEGSQAVDSYVAPFAGEVVAIAGTLSAAATAGTLTVGATINGTENASTTQTVTTAAEFRAAFARGTARFVAGDNLGAEITSDGSWDATTSDLSVQLYVIYELSGI
jgi:hypothetical protein